MLSSSDAVPLMAEIHDRKHASWQRTATRLLFSFLLTFAMVVAVAVPCGLRTVCSMAAGGCRRAQRSLT